MKGGKTSPKKMKRVRARGEVGCSKCRWREGGCGTCRSLAAAEKKADEMKADEMPADDMEEDEHVEEE